MGKHQYQSSIAASVGFYSKTNQSPAEWFRRNPDRNDYLKLCGMGLDDYLAERPDPITVANFLKTEIYGKAKGGLVPECVRDSIVELVKIEDGRSLSDFPDTGVACKRAL